MKDSITALIVAITLVSVPVALMLAFGITGFYVTIGLVVTAFVWAFIYFEVLGNGY